MRRAFMQYILIADDNEDIREVLSTYVVKEGFEPIVAEDGIEAFETFKKCNPAVVLLDIMMPGLDGYKVCQKIREISQVPIILITAKGEDYERVMGLDIGADDYITKPFGVMELISRVRALIRRSMDTGADKSIRVGNIFLDSDRHIVYVDDEPKELTFKEYELLRCLMNNSGVAMHRDRIMELVWGVDFEGESRTLDMHIKTLRQKLGSAGAMIKTVRNVGYVLEP